MTVRILNVICMRKGKGRHVKKNKIGLVNYLMFTNTLHFSLNEFWNLLKQLFFPFWLIFRVMGLTGQDFRTVGALGQEILQKRAGRAEHSVKNGYNEIWHLILDFWVICKDNKKRGEECYHIRIYMTVAVT